MVTRINSLLKERQRDGSNRPSFRRQRQQCRFDFVTLTSLAGRCFDWRHDAFETREVVRVAYGIKDAKSRFFSALSCAGVSLT